MKKIISIIICLMMLATFVSAGNNRAPTPRPFEVYVFHEGAAVEGFNLEFSVNGQTVNKKTNSAGGVMVDWDLGYSADFPLGKEITGLSFYTQVLSVRCGLDVCDKDYPFDGLDIPKSIVINLADAPVIIDDPEPEPEPTPEPVIEENVNSNSDDSIASIDVFYGEEINVCLEDNKLAKLQDKEIDFDGKDYNIHEKLCVNAFIKTSLDDSKYGIIPYLVIPEGGVTHEYIFDDIIPMEEIADDEVLEITFLGEKMDIVHRTASSITVRYGEAFESMPVGSDKTYNGKVINLYATGSDGDGSWIYVNYNGEGKKIYEGNIAEVGGVQILADEVVHNPDADSFADIRVAEDIEVTIKDREHYNDGDVWDWIITEDIIGITNQEEYDDLSEEFVPLAEGDKIVLPNNFTTIKFNEVTKPVYTELDIMVKDTYLRIRGPVDSLADDYDEILIDAAGIYDEDLNLISEDKVRVGESDIYIKKVGSEVQIGALTVLLDMSDILYDGISYSLKDDIYLDYQGIIFSDPEEAVIDKSGFEVIVPDERPEVTITIGKEPEPKEDTECPATQTDTCPEEKDCPAETVCKDTTCLPCVQTECSDEDDSTVPEGDNIGALIISAIAVLLAGGFGGKYFTKNTAVGTQGGIKVYRGRDGIEKVKHIHKGIRGYHDPYTSHRDTVERHPRGQMLPHYKQNEKGVWEYIK